MVEVKQKKEVDNVVMDKADISAVANSRYFRKSGMKLLLIWAFMTLLVTMAHSYVGLPDIAAYILLGIVAISFVYMFSKGQTEVREKLWHNIEQNRINKQESQKV